MNTELQEYIGKKVTINLEKLIDGDVELDWFCDYNNNDDPILEGSAHVNLDYRSYNSIDDGDQDEEEFDESDDDDHQDDEEYDESDNWWIQTGINFETDKNGCLTSIEITARVSCFGDSGLGECNPDDEWTSGDYERAKAFLNQITKK